MAGLYLRHHFAQRVNVSHPHRIIEKFKYMDGEKTRAALMPRSSIIGYLPTFKHAAQCAKNAYCALAARFERKEAGKEGDLNFFMRNNL